jgi:hypothetical protein
MTRQRVDAQPSGMQGDRPATQQEAMRRLRCSSALPAVPLLGVCVLPLLLFLFSPPLPVFASARVSTGLVNDAAALRIAVVVNCVFEGGRNILTAPERLPADFDIKTCGSETHE